MPDGLLDRLHAVRRRMRRVQAIAGAAQVIIALVVLLAAYFAIDFFITSRIFPSGNADFIARLVLLIAGVALWLRVFYTRFWAPVTRHYSDDDIAMLVEARYPELNGRLISTVQLTRAGAGNAARYLASAQMIAALDEQTRAVAAHLPFAGIISFRLLKRAVLLAVILCGIGVAIGFWQSRYAERWLERMSLQPVSYPTSTRILSFTHGGNLVAGEPLIIHVKLDPHRYLPDVVHLVVQPIHRSAYSMTLHPLPHQPAEFSGVVRNTLAAFTYRLQAYDAYTPWQTEHVWQRPSVKAMQITCVYPPYVHRPPHVTQGGDVTVPAGTLLKVSATLLSPCQQAQIVLRLRIPQPAPAAGEAAGRSSSTANATTHQGHGTAHAYPGRRSITRTLAMQLMPGGLQAQGQWTANHSGHFFVRLLDRHDLRNLHPTVHFVQAIPDLPPVVHIHFPTRTEDATPFAVWPIRFSVSDQYGLTHVYLVYHVRRPSPESGTAQAPGAADLGNSASTQSVAATAPQPANGAGPPASGPASTRRYGPLHKISLPGLVSDQVRAIKRGLITLNFTGLRVTPHCRVEYWVEAYNNHEPEPMVGRSRRLRFRIEDAAVLKNRAMRRIDSAMRSLRRARTRSDKTATGIQSLTGKVPAGQ